MIINHNLNSMNAHRNMSFNTNQTGKAMEKLSSGLRINRAGDDAAGLAISEKMRGQIRGLDQASRNAQDGISLVQTAEGALNESHDILQRMRELSVQASNDTNTLDDRKEIQKEVDQLISEIDRIGNNTEFNTKKLINGNAGFSAEVSASAGVKVISGGNAATGTITLTSVTAASKAEVRIEAFDVSNASEALTVANSQSFTLNGETITTDASANIGELVSSINALSDKTGVVAKLDGNVLVLNSTQSGSSSQIEVNGLNSVISNSTTDVTTNGTSTSATSPTAVGASVSGAGNDAVVNASAVGGGAIVSSGNTATVVGGSFDGLQFKVDPFANGASGKIDVTSNNSLKMQIGSNETQTIDIAINDMRASALGVDAIDVENNAETAISTIDSAIQAVSAERSKLGATQNRLEHTINNLNVGAENLQAAESRIRDVDMAKEMMNFTKNNILNQAAQAMMAQSNQQPQAVLQLLR